MSTIIKNTQVIFLWFFFILIIQFSLVKAESHSGQFKQTLNPTLSSSGEFHHQKQHDQIAIDLLSSGSPFSIVKKLAPQVSGNLIGPVTDAIDYDENASLNGASVPPDNSGAVGPDHFVLAVNVAIQWFTKDRTKQHSESLNTFFSPNAPQYDLFDPKVIYDQYNQRFVVMVIEESDVAKVSYFHIAVSQTSNPNDGWYFQKVNSKVNISGTDCWSDFPGFAVSSEAIYITANMFNFSIFPLFQGSRLWILDKGVYSGGTSSVSIYDPSTEAGLGSQAFTMQPAHMFGSQPSNVGTFLFSTDWDDGNGNNDLINIIRIDDPLAQSGGPTFTSQFVNPGEIHNNSSGVPDMPQSGSSTNIDCGDNRAQYAVWRDNSMIGCFTVNPSSGSEAGQATAFWFDVNTTTLSSLSITQQGYIDGEDIATDTYTCYPAVSVNQDGDIAIGFSASAATIYAGAYYTLHNAGDAPGTVGASNTLHAGEDYYVRTFGGGRNRWGDYSAMSVDPEDDLNFWVFNQYAMLRGSPSGSEDGRWATCFGSFGTIETPQFLKGDNITSTSLKLHWSGRSAEFRLLQDGSQIYAGTDTFYNVSALSPSTSYTFEIYGKASGQNYYSSDKVTLQVTTAPSGSDPNPTEVISSTQTISAGGGTSEFEIEDTGIWLTFPSGTSTSTSFTSVKKSGDPGIVGSLPSGISKIATDRNWTVTASAGTSVGTYNIRFDLTGVAGIQNFNTLKILKRADSSSPWQEVGSLGATYAYNDPYITVQGLTSFSDFAIASTGDNSLPVELSFFSAAAHPLGIELTWTTQSEVNNAGFIIERSGNEEGPFTVIASYETDSTLLGQGTSSLGKSYRFLDSKINNGGTYWYKLVDVSYLGNRGEHGPVKVDATYDLGTLHSVYSGTMPRKYALRPNFPNPFNPQTRIQFEIPVGERNYSKISLTVYDVRGRKIRELFSGGLEAGRYELIWHGDDQSGNLVPSGVYFCLFRYQEKVQVIKMSLLR